MRICSFSLGGDARVGVLLGEQIADLERAFALSIASPSAAQALDAAQSILPPTCEAFVADLEVNQALAEQALSALKGLGRRRRSAEFDGLPVVFDPDDVRLLPPVSEVTVFCMARNYVAHAAEFAKKRTAEFKEELPLYCFLKPATCINGPNDPVFVNRSMKRVDYELELAVVIGRGGRHIPVDRAMEHVGGYTILNDMSDRGRLLKSPGRLVDWYHMKAPDGFAPLGPYILLPGEADPHRLRMRLWVNGELRQNASTREMVWKIPDIVSYLSGVATLRPGDVITTGSPEGNAASWGAYLQPGDVIEGEIQKIGRQRFEIVQQPKRYTVL